MEINENWAETIAAVFLLMGFFVSLLIHNPILGCIIIILSGFLAGRILYIKYFKEPIFPFILIIVGFLVGYLLSSFRSSKLLIILFFVSSTALSYYLHQQKILVIFKSREFLK